MGISIPCYCSAILKDPNRFYFFDPHSRNECRMLTCERFATMTIYENVGALCLFIRHLAAYLMLPCDVQLEVASLTLQDEFKFLYQGSFDTNDSKFPGFDSVSEGELACKLYLAEHLSDSSSVSSCSSVALSGTSVFSASIGDVTLDEAVSNLDDNAVYLQSIYVENFDNMSDSEGYENVNVGSEFFIAKPVVENDMVYDGDDDGDNDVDHNNDVKNPDYQVVDDDDDDNVPLINYKRKDNADIVNSKHVQTSRREHKYHVNDDLWLIQLGRRRKRVRNENGWKRNMAKRRKHEDACLISTGWFPKTTSPCLEPLRFVQPPMIMFTFDK